MKYQWWLRIGCSQVRVPVCVWGCDVSEVHQSVDEINTHPPDPGSKLTVTRENLTSSVKYKDGHRDIFAALGGKDTTRVNLGLL